MRTAQQATDYESVQKSLQASEEREQAVKHIRARIAAMTQKHTLMIYADRIAIATLSDQLKKRAAKWIQERIKEL